MADSKLVTNPSKLVTNPLDEIRAILILYTKHQIGAAGADGQIMKILFRKGYARKQQTQAMRVCFHRLNRGGVIGSSQEAQPLMEEIAEVFWSDSEIDHALCVEVELGVTTDEDAFRAWCEAAGGDFPPVEKGSIEFVSLVCGTTNTGLRAICWGCRSESKTLGNGTHLDVEVIRKHDPPYV